MTACDVRVTRRTNSVIMQHWPWICKSKPYASRIVPRQCKTSTHRVEEGSADISQNHFVRNMALDMKITT